MTALYSPRYPEERLKYNLDCKYALFSLLNHALNTTQNFI